MEDFFTKVLNLFLIKCEKLSLLFIDFGLKHCIKTETFKNSITGRSQRRLNHPQRVGLWKKKNLDKKKEIC